MYFIFGFKQKTHNIMSTLPNYVYWQCIKVQATHTELLQSNAHNGCDKTL